MSKAQVLKYFIAEAEHRKKREGKELKTERRKMKKKCVELSKD